MAERLTNLSHRAKKLAPYLLVAVVAFFVGGLIFSGPSEPPADPHADHQDTSDQIWTCAMHPQIRQSEPGNCPICGMTLVPVASSSQEEARPDRITLSERAKVLAKLRTTEVRRQTNPSASVRLLGRIEPDESSSKMVTTWVGGRIDRLHVSVTGEKVRAGQTIATLYSPEILAAHQDLIASQRQIERMKAASDTARAAASAALDASRDRLRLLGLLDDRIKAMAAETEPARQVAIHSPFTGTVIERLATEGSYVTTGEPLYRIADLSRVWVQLDAYERDLAGLRVGQTVRITVDALAEASFEGKVAFIDPTVDRVRRTARVRIEVPNRDGRLRPGMFAQAVVEERNAETKEAGLVIPHTAVLFTGRRAVVYVEVVDAERPTYEARIVRLGARAGDVYPVVEGLSEGERIVTRGAFALDADLQIRGGSSMMTGPDDTVEDSQREVRMKSGVERPVSRPASQPAPRAAPQLAPPTPPQPAPRPASQPSSRPAAEGHVH